MLDLSDPRAKKLQEYIEQGRESVTTALHSIQEEFNVRRDRMVRPSALDFEIGEDSVLHPIILAAERMPSRALSAIIEVTEQQQQQHQGDRERLNFTAHSESQAYARASIPQIYARKLIELDRADVLLYSLRELTRTTQGEGVLIRSVGPTLKGWLSPAYKRIDAAPVLEAFLEACLKAGYAPYVGRNTDFRYNVGMIYPQVFSPLANEFTAYGVSLSTGDYGEQALSIGMMVLRILCKNLATGMDLMRRVHLGSRFLMGEGEEQIEFSNKTHLLDSATQASAVKDVVRHSTDTIRLLEDGVKRAGEKQIPEKELTGYFEAMKKRGASKEISDKVKALYQSAAPVELLPQGNTAWRLSNAISLVALGEKSGDKQIDLEKEAFSLLGVEKGKNGNGLNGTLF